MLDSTRWRRIEALLDEASGAAPASREEILDAGCRDEKGVLDEALRDEVRRLLALDDEADGFFGGLRDATLGAGGDGALDAPALDDLVGREVGCYRVEARVGTGGMGAVYRARRADGAYRRPVAIKVVRPGLSADVGPRFRRERELLGSLDHPNVARLLDTGALPDGRPWLAMEYVEGETITAYADRQRLGVDARIRLFLQVCDAVAYAHRALIVHRDLKPSNILVASGEAGDPGLHSIEDEGGASGARGTARPSLPRTSAPRVKLLDFGVATLVREDGAATTHTGRTLLTPAYAAPEQIRDEPASTAADVYALGALLYELLTGSKTVQTEGCPAHEVAQAVLDHSPPAPSAAFTADNAGARGLSPAQLSRRLRGDLDRVVMMALRKEPERRYSSVEAFARDLRRHLEGRVVEARPDTVGYRLATFVRRNRVSVAAGAVALAAVLGGAGLTLWQAREARSESARATAQAERAVEVAAFMTDLLGDFDPSRSQGGLLSADSVLARAALRVRSGLDAHPDVRAQLLGSLGKIYQSYAHFDRADSLLREALDLRREHFGNDHPDVATGLRDLGWLAYVRGDYGRAEVLYTDALALHRGAAEPDPLAIAADLEGLGIISRVRGEYEAALRELREALAIREAQLPPEDERITATLNQIAYVLYDLQRFREAEPLYQRVLEVRRRTMGEHVQTAQVLNDYAALLLADGRASESIALHKEALGIRRRLLGPDHPHVAQSLSQVGWALQSDGRYAEAETLYVEALGIRQRHFGDVHVSVANSLVLVGEARALQGDTSAGLALIARGARTMERALGADNRTAKLARLRYVEGLIEAGQIRRAREEARGLYSGLRDARDPDSPAFARLRAVRQRLG
ncbi:serine/threonine-protein kinase [Rubricoccus marinus]|uniref:Protein kinase domain-containing protein n=1 Tax=Rubricoccus marinus TaxID=716817 RepID=A0A259TVU1_9BACT|nr:serine/threonine-protein kinase [Rubricoccus marinus]OZC01747.1 hypothetical protein BSZ36_01345 [Rubricoccus marinus]